MLTKRSLNQLLIIAIIVCSVLIIAALCWLFLSKLEKTAKKSTRQQAVSIASVPKSNTIIIPIEPQNNSGQKGSAKFEEISKGKVKVSINLIGGNYKTVQPTHIHSGTCQKPGAIKYSLNEVMSNLSETVIDTTLDELKNSGPLILNVHKSDKESQLYTACGTIPQT